MSDDATDATDAARYRWLRATLHGAVGGGVEVNDDKLVYQEAEPGEEVRLYWYPDTPVGFYEMHGATLDEAIDKAMSATLAEPRATPDSETNPAPPSGTGRGEDE